MDKTEIEMNMNVELVDLEDGTFQVDGSQKCVLRICESEHYR